MARDHPGREELLGCAEGSYVPHRIRVHVRHCTSCRRVLDEYETLVRAMRSDRLSEPGSRILEQVRRLAGRRPGRTRVVEVAALQIRGPSELDRSIGLRGEPAAPAELQYEAEGLEVDLELTAEPGGWRVTGQVLAPPGQELPVVVWAEGEDRATSEAPVGDHGEFVLEHVPEAVSGLVFDLGDRRLRLPLPSEPRE